MDKWQEREGVHKLKRGNRVIGEIYHLTYPKSGSEYVAYNGAFRGWRQGKCRQLGYFYDLESAKDAVIRQ